MIPNPVYMSVTNPLMIPMMNIADNVIRHPLFPLSISFHRFYGSFDNPYHLLRDGSVQHPPYIGFQVAVCIFVVDRKIPLFPLACPGLLHIQEADMDRIRYVHLAVGFR